MRVCTAMSCTWCLVSSARLSGNLRSERTSSPVPCIRWRTRPGSDFHPGDELPGIPGSVRGGRSRSFHHRAYQLSPRAPEIAYIIGDAAPVVLIFEQQYEQLISGLRSQLPSVQHYICIGADVPRWARSYEETLAGGAEEGHRYIRARRMCQPSCTPVGRLAGPRGPC